MFTQLTPPLPATVVGAADQLSALLSILSRPAECQALLDQLKNNVQQANEAYSAAVAEQQTLATAKAEHEARVQADLADLQQRRDEWYAERARQEARLSEQQQTLAARQSELDSKLEAAETLRQKLEQRLARIQAAAA
jgi:predicted nuclease with TOPRIM domain